MDFVKVIILKQYTCRWEDWTAKGEEEAEKLWLNWSVKSRTESGKSQGKVREFYFFNCVATLKNMVIKMTF